MTSTSKPQQEDYLASILARTSKAALEGKLSDEDRVALYRLALTIAAHEFHRIEANSGHGLVSPEVLLLLQQIVLVCDDKVDRDKLLGPMGLTAEDVADAQSQVQEHDGSESDVTPIRATEPGPPNGDEDVDGSVRTDAEDGEESP